MKKLINKELFMIKILSGSKTTDSTTLYFSSLCTLFNAKGYECEFYTADNYFLHNTNAIALKEFEPQKDDILIIHDLKINNLTELNRLKDSIALENLKRKKHKKLKNLKITIKSFFASFKNKPAKIILSCANNNSLDLNNNFYDKIHFLSQIQKTNCLSKKSFFICPEIISELKPSDSKPDKIAGVIGNITRDKNTHLSIIKALDCGMETVILYGFIKDAVYFYETIEPLMKEHRGKIKVAGFIKDKQKIYDSISEVFDSSANKVFSLIPIESKMTETKFNGSFYSDELQEISDESIFEIWKKELDLIKK